MRRRIACYVDCVRQHIVRDGRRGSVEQPFDLKVDPWVTRNVYGQPGYRQVVQSLLALH